MGRVGYASGLVSLILILAPTAKADAIKYAAVDMGSPQGVIRSVPYGINNRGQVVGGSASSSGTSTSFLYSGGQISAIGSPGMQAHAINDSGQVVYDNAYAINNAGVIVGGVGLGGPSDQAYILSGGTRIDLAAMLPGDLSSARGINDAGSVVGYSVVNGQSIPFLYSGGSISNPFSGLAGVALAINNSGEIAGYSAAGRALLAIDGRTLDLGTLGGGFSESTALNSSGEVVGEASTATGALHAFLYTGDRMLDLNDLTKMTSGITLSYALGINDRGQIIAAGLDGDNNLHAILLDPITVPEPGTCLIMSSIFAVVFASGRGFGRRMPRCNS